MSRTAVTPRGLIPDFALEHMPAPIRKAQEAVKAAVDAEARSRDRLRVARAALNAADDVDAEATAAAARKADDPPLPTKPQREAEHRAAMEARRVLQDDRDEAKRKLDRVVIANLDQAITAWNKVLAQEREGAIEDAETLIDRLERLGQAAGVAVGLANADEFKVSGTKGKRHVQLGKLRFDGNRRVDEAARLHSLIPAIRIAVETYGREVTETVGQAQEREQREHEERPYMPRSMLGGIHVGID